MSSRSGAVHVAQTAIRFLKGKDYIVNIKDLIEINSWSKVFSYMLRVTNAGDSQSMDG